MLQTNNKIKNEYGRSTKLTPISLVYQVISRILVKGASTIPYMPSIGRYDITLCHQHKFIWFRVAKAASRTILDAFKEADIILDAQHPYSCHYPVNLYQGYFKFAFVRNPWSRLVSCWLDKVVARNFFKFSTDELLKMQKFENFIDFVAHQNLNTGNEHIRLQSKLIDINNIDYIGKIENFDTDLTKILEHIGINLDLATIEHKHASKSRLHYSNYYDEKLKQKVAKIYAKDINIFSYHY